MLSVVNTPLLKCNCLPQAVVFSDIVLYFPSLVISVAIAAPSTLLLICTTQKTFNFYQVKLKQKHFIPERLINYFK